MAAAVAVCYCACVCSTALLVAWRCTQSGVHLCVLLLGAPIGIAFGHLLCMTVRR